MNGGSGGGGGDWQRSHTEKAPGHFIDMSAGGGMHY